jgi:AcrR family transcriptional regulator
MINAMVGQTHAKPSPKRSGRTTRPAARGQQSRAPHRREPPAAATPLERPRAPAGAGGGSARQRERLLGAIAHLAAREGDEAPTVAEIIAVAGVSRPTFYEYFTDREDCCLAAIAPIHRQLLTDIRKAVRSKPPEQALSAVARTLFSFAGSRPDAARLLICDPLAGGPRLLDDRDELIERVAVIVEDAFAEVPPSTMVPDASPELLVGVICRLLASHMQDGRPPLREMLPEILDWLASYELPAGEHRWRAPETAPAAARAPFLAPAVLRAPPPLPRARARIPDDAVAENQWLRIVFATAEIVAKDGYAATTVVEITRCAGVDSRVFYRLFACKREAFAAARELLFRHVMAVTAGAFAVGETWPERIWQAASAFTDYLDQNATLTSAALIETHAGGTDAARRFENLMSGFTIFLQEGERCEPPGGPRPHTPPSVLAQRAIVTAVLEIYYRHARATDGETPSARLAQVAFMILAPFIGAAPARAFLAQKAHAGADPPPAAPEQSADTPIEVQRPLLAAAS